MNNLLTKCPVSLALITAIAIFLVLAKPFNPEVEQAKNILPANHKLVVTKEKNSAKGNTIAEKTIDESLPESSETTDPGFQENNLAKQDDPA